MAKAMINDGKATPACKMLGAFIDQVEAMVAGGTLTDEEGAGLTALAEAAIEDACG